jgi:hypothetical protein
LRSLRSAAGKTVSQQFLAIAHGKILTIPLDIAGIIDGLVRHFPNDAARRVRFVKLLV